MHSEQVVLVDAFGRPTGTAAKETVHTLDCPRHLGFSCYVFNRSGLFLATRRASTKKTWPGWWTNSCCGHPAADESGAHAVRRRLDYELGLAVTDLRIALPDFSYTATWEGASENELCPVFLAITDEDPQANPDEVMQHKWVPYELFVEQAATITPWAQEQIALLAEPIASFRSDYGLPVPS